MKLNEYLSGRLVEKTETVSISRTEKQFLEYIFSSDEYLKTNFNLLEFSETSCLLGRSFFYDSYKFNCKDRTFCIKIGDKEDDFIFRRERDILKKIEKTNLSPTFLNFYSCKSYSYLLTTLEHGLPIKEFRLPFLQSNLPTIGANLAYLHEKTFSHKKDYTEDFMQEIYDYGDFESVLDEEIYKELKELKIFPEICECLDFIKQSIKQQMVVGSNASSICHLNLTQSNILERAGMIKFVNFHKARRTNPMFDLAFCAIKSGISTSEHMEKIFVENYVKYHKHFNKFSDVYETFLCYKQVSAKLILYEMLCSYVYELIFLDDTYPYFDYFNMYQIVKEEVGDELCDLIKTTDEIFGNFEV